MKCRLNFKHFESKGYLYRFSIFEVTESENVVTEISKKFRFRRCFDKQNGKRAQALFKFPSHHLYQIQWSLPSQLSQKKSLLLTWKILVLPVHTLAADEKYPVLNRDNLKIAIQMQLSRKQKTFSPFYPAFLKSCWNFENFEKKMTLTAFVFSKLWTPKT